MIQLYEDKIREVETELGRIKKCIDRFSGRKNPLNYIKDINIYRNYALIYAYGCIEDVIKKIVADYYSQINMPEKCKNFADFLLSYTKALTCNKENLLTFFSKECSKSWKKELKIRENSMKTDKKSNSYTYKDMYMGLNLLTQERNAFAHGNNQYSGTIQDIIDQFKRCKAYLYEIDNIINDSGLKG